MTPALSLAAPFPGLANVEASSKGLARSSKDMAKKDLASGEESWLAVLLAMTVPAWPAAAPLPALPAMGAPEPGGPAVFLPWIPETSLPLPAPAGTAESGGPVVFLPWVLDAATPLPEPPPPVVVGVEAPTLALVDEALTLAPAPPGEPTFPTVAEPVRQLDPPPQNPEAFRLEIKWQTAELGPSAPPITAGPAKSPEPAKPDQPEVSRPQPVAVARPDTAVSSDDGPPERDPDPERHPAPPPAAPRSVSLVERAMAREPDLPGNQIETPLRSVRPAVEAPVPQPAPLRASGDPPGPPPSPGPPELHGLERAIERAELRQTPQTSELNLWMRPEHLGKVAVRLIERAGVVEIAVRAETSLARSWLAEGLPGLFDRLHARDFETRPALRGAEAGLDGRSQDHLEGRRQQARDGQKRRDREAALFSLEPGETT